MTAPGGWSPRCEEGPVGDARGRGNSVAFSGQGPGWTHQPGGLLGCSCWSEPVRGDTAGPAEGAFRVEPSGAGGTRTEQKPKITKVASHSAVSLGIFTTRPCPPQAFSIPSDALISKMALGTRTSRRSGCSSPLRRRRPGRTGAARGPAPGRRGEQDACWPLAFAESQPGRQAARLCL